MYYTRTKNRQTLTHSEGHLRIPVIVCFDTPFYSTMREHVCVFCTIYPTTCNCWTWTLFYSVMTDVYNVTMLQERTTHIYVDTHSTYRWQKAQLREAICLSPDLDKPVKGIHLCVLTLPPCVEKRENHPLIMVCFPRNPPCPVAEYVPYSPGIFQ